LVCTERREELKEIGEEREKGGGLDREQERGERSAEGEGRD
jgi:hypothetical protein